MSIRVVMGDLLPEPGRRWTLTSTWALYTHVATPALPQRKPPIYGDNVLLSYGCEGAGTMWLDLVQFAPNGTAAPLRTDDELPTWAMPVPDRGRPRAGLSPSPQTRRSA